MSFTTFVLWIHLVLIVAWVGGLFAVSLVFVPVIRRTIEAPVEAARMSAMAIRRFARISREIIFLIFLTGIFNVINAGMARSFQFGGGYMQVLTVKFGLFLAIIMIQMWQSLKIAPAIETAAAGGADAVRGPYRAFLWTSLLAFALGATAVLMGLKLKYGW